MQNNGSASFGISFFSSLVKSFFCKSEKRRMFGYALSTHFLGIDRSKGGCYIADSKDRQKP